MKVRIMMGILDTHAYTHMHIRTIHIQIILYTNQFDSFFVHIFHYFVFLILIRII